MKSILIISRPQFGYHTDIYKWCQYLNDSYNVKVLTFDDGKEKFSIDGVTNIYVPNAGFRVLRGLLFMLISSFHLFQSKGIVLICYFKECILYKKLFPNKRMILDIRTLDISEDEKIRKRNDDALKRCVQLFDFVTYISEGIRKKACVPIEKSALLPLGAEKLSYSNRAFDKLHLLYVGTLYGRNLEKTISGLSIAINNLNETIEYEIIGDSIGSELERLRDYVKVKGLEHVVHMHGYVRHDRLAPLYEKCNIGISFIPMTDYYEYQPPTKTFEYALSGLYVIATDTTANREIITSENGCLIKDTAESFATALIEISRRRNSIDSTKVRSSLEEYEWRNIVNKYLKVILNSFDRLDENTAD